MGTTVHRGTRRGHDGGGGRWWVVGVDGCHGGGGGWWVTVHPGTRRGYCSVELEMREKCVRNGQNQAPSPEYVSPESPDLSGPVGETALDPTSACSVPALTHLMEIGTASSQCYSVPQRTQSSALGGE